MKKKRYKKIQSRPFQPHFSRKEHFYAFLTPERDNKMLHI